jgi:hypothetical protein
MVAKKESFSINFQINKRIGWNKVISYQPNLKSRKKQESVK